MFTEIIRHTPYWVWLLLIKLLALGLWQTHARQMSLMRVTILPLVLMALSLAGVFSAFGPLPIALIAWFVGVGAALGFGREVVAVRAAHWSAQTALLHVPGSWLPLVLIVGLFTIKYVAGATLAIYPGLATDSAFAGLCSLAYGSFSGLFLARALSLRSHATGGARGLQTA